jgi:hypothetical protein
MRVSPHCVFKVVPLLHHEDPVFNKSKVTICGYHSTVKKVLNLKDYKSMGIGLPIPKREGSKNTMNALVEVVLDPT